MEEGKGPDVVRRVQVDLFNSNTSAKSSSNSRPVKAQIGQAFIHSIIQSFTKSQISLQIIAIF